MEFTSGYIKTEEFWHEIKEIHALFKRFGAEELTVSYGFGCNLEPDELYQHKEIKTANLLDFLSRSMAEGIYYLAEDDFHIQSKSLGVNFLLCHESDIHLETENTEFAAYLKARWAVKEYPGYEKLSEGWVSLLNTQAPEAKMQQATAAGNTLA